MYQPILFKKSFFLASLLWLLLHCGTLYSQPSDVTGKAIIESNDGKTFFSFSLGPSMLIHLRDKDSENEFIPDEFEVLEERPSIAAFYLGRIGIRSEILAKVQNDYIPADILFGLSYDYQLLKENNEYNVDILLGDKLNLHVVHPFVGLSYETQSKSFDSYIKIGPSIRKYFGKASASGIDFIQNYKTSVGLRISGGFSSMTSFNNDKIILGIELGLDLGTVIRDDIVFFQNDTKIARAEITGAESMRDYFLSISLTIGYKF